METRRYDTSGGLENKKTEKKEETTATPFPLHELPADLLKENTKAKSPSIGKYLSSIDKIYLSLVNKKLFSIFQADIKLANILIKQFLLHVALGEKKEAEEMIKCEPRLLLEKRTIEDEAGRQIYGTALQIALGAKDVSLDPKQYEEMVEMIERYLKQHYDEEEIATQRAEQFPEGWEKEEEARRKHDSEAIKKVFAAIDKATTNEKAEEAVKEFQAYLKKQTEVVITTGYHFNEKLFEEAFELYDSHYNNGFGGYDSPKNRLAAIKVIGGIEKYFTANLAQAACDGFGLVANEKKPLSRGKMLDDKKTSFFDSNLGVSHFAYSYYGMSWLPGGVARRGGSVDFFKTYVEQNNNLINRQNSITKRAV